VDGVFKQNPIGYLDNLAHLTVRGGVFALAKSRPHERQYFTVCISYITVADTN